MSDKNDMRLWIVTGLAVITFIISAGGMIYTRGKIAAQNETTAENVKSLDARITKMEHTNSRQDLSIQSNSLTGKHMRESLDDIKAALLRIEARLGQMEKAN
jgi:uncharacterized coiled-coil protein SlyX